MAREILFRGIDDDTGGWVYGSFCMDALEQMHGPSDIPGFIRFFDKAKGKMQMREVDRETVGQFTGCLDANERRIFEGDICRYHDPLISGTTDYEVVWFPEGSQWGVRELGSSGIYIDHLDDYFCLHCEVVGTIFDNRT